MKKITLVFFILFSVMTCFGQKPKIDSCYFITDTLTGKQIYRFVDKPATVTGSKDSMMMKIIKCIKYNKQSPETAEASIAIAFVIDEHGVVSGKRIIRGKLIGQQILDMLDEFEWQPATCGGVKVAALYFLPLSIHFSDD
jgi:hypothetical protein